MCDWNGILLKNIIKVNFLNDFNFFIIILFKCYWICVVIGNIIDNLKMDLKKIYYVIENF